MHILKVQILLLPSVFGHVKEHLGVCTNCRRRPDSTTDWHQPHQHLTPPDPPTAELLAVQLKLTSPTFSTLFQHPSRGGGVWGGWGDVCTYSDSLYRSYRLPCKLRVFRQNNRTCPSRRTAEKQESSVESRAEGNPSGHTPAHSSPLPQSSASRMAKCCSITSWACWKNHKDLMSVHPLDNECAPRMSLRLQDSRGRGFPSG